MWVRKKEWDTLKEKVAALEEEQLQLRKRIKEEEGLTRKNVWTYG